MGGELHVHKNGALFVLDAEHCFGAVHPRDSAISDAALLLCAQLRDQITAGIYPRGADDTVFLTRREFQREMMQCHTQYAAGWGRRLRELSLDKLAQELIAYLTGWMILEPQAEGFLLYPAVGKWIGHYPARYQDRVGEEAEDEPLEDA